MREVPPASRRHLTTTNFSKGRNLARTRIVQSAQCIL